MSLLLIAAADAAAAAAAAAVAASPSQLPWMLVNGLPNDDDVEMK